MLIKMCLAWGIGSISTAIVGRGSMVMETGRGTHPGTSLGGAMSRTAIIWLVVILIVVALAALWIINLAGGRDRAGLQLDRTES